MLLLLFCLCSSVTAQPAFSPGDWTSYKDCRYARSLDVGTRSVFVATSGGLLEYDLYRHDWVDPVTIGYGWQQPVSLGDPILVLYDQVYELVWLANRDELLQYELQSQIWTITDRDKWLGNDRVVNLGVAGNDLYVETIPSQIYPQLFAPQDPLPNPSWPQYVTRYIGSRRSGGLMLDLERDEPEDAHWRGLRSRLPLTGEELYGMPGLPTANFPPIVLPSPYIWHNDGTILDGAMRGAPVTDWAVDRMGYLWSTHWGAGIVRSDIRVTRGNMYLPGPAGNDVRAILVERDAVWLGGLNSGERTGISRASPELDQWQVFETRSDSRLRSTDVADLAEIGGEVFAATIDGLSAYHKKKGRWTLYGVSDGLYSNEVTALATRDKELWIGTNRGLSVMALPSHEVNRIVNPGIEISGVLDVAICRDTVMVATGNGLFRGPFKSRQFEFQPLDPGLLNAPVLELSVQGADVWLATSEGVMKYNQNTGESEIWYAEDWLSGATPTCIHAMEKFVWVGTQNNGFFRFRKETREWVGYTIADGLVSNHVQAIRSDGDDLLIGTAEGLTRFWWNRPGRAR